MVDSLLILSIIPSGGHQLFSTILMEFFHISLKVLHSELRLLKIVSRLRFVEFKATLQTYPHSGGKTGARGINEIQNNIFSCVRYLQVGLQDHLLSSGA